MKRILILTADYGYGRCSAANAIAAALKEAYGQECLAEIVNPSTTHTHRRSCEKTRAIMTGWCESYLTCMNWGTALAKTGRLGQSLGYRIKHICTPLTKNLPLGRFLVVNPIYSSAL
jgi:hypothetical protein